MTALYWFIFGILLLVFELATPGFVAMFFGMAALTVALISWMFPLGQIYAWLLFAALSVLYILILRKFLKKIFLGDLDAPDRLEDSFVGKHAEVTEAIAPDQPGKVEFSGCAWEAESESEIAVGERVKICAKKNLTLSVQREI